MNNETNPTTLSQNTTGNTSTLSQLSTITEAFKGDDFLSITSDEYKKNPLAGKMMAMLYAESEKKLNAANDKILDLSKQVSYYRSFPMVNIAYSIMNIVGTIVVGLGVSLCANLWLIISGGLLVFAGNILPLFYSKKPF